MALLDILKKKKEQMQNKRGTNADLTPVPPKRLRGTARNERGANAEMTQTPRGMDVEQMSTKDKAEAMQTPKKRKTKTDAPRGKQDTPKGELFSHIIIRQRITEKASTGGGKNAYTFEVAMRANKLEIKKAVKEIYNVLPTRVNIINVKPKQKMVRNTLGKTASFKKAIVFLKEGDTIEFV